CAVRVGTLARDQSVPAVPTALVPCQLAPGVVAEVLPRRLSSGIGNRADSVGGFEAIGQALRHLAAGLVHGADAEQAALVVHAVASLQSIAIGPGFRAAEGSIADVVDDRLAGAVARRGDAVQPT